MDTTTTVSTVNRELVISSDVSEVNIVLLEDKQLVEYHKEKDNSNFAVGDIYYGRIRKILPGLNAAFVDIGNEKDAFLHYLDLGPQIRSLIQYSKMANEGKTAQTYIESMKLLADIDKSGKITDFLQAADCQGANQHKGAAYHRRDFLCGQVCGISTVFQQGIGIAEDTQQRGAQPVKEAHPQHQAEQLRSHHTHRGRGQEGGGA